jgi:hypothetical protein
MDGVGIQGTHCIGTKTDGTRIHGVGIQGTQCVRADGYTT